MKILEKFLFKSVSIDTGITVEGFMADKGILLTSDNTKIQVNPNKLGIFLSINNETYDKFYTSDVIKVKREEIELGVRHITENVDYLLDNYKYVYSTTYYCLNDDIFITIVWFTDINDNIIFTEEGKIHLAETNTNFTKYAFQKECEISHISDEKYQTISEELDTPYYFQDFQYFHNYEKGYITEFSNFNVFFNGKIINEDNISIPTWHYTFTNKQTQEVIVNSGSHCDDVPFKFNEFIKYLEEINALDKRKKTINKLKELGMDEHSLIRVKFSENDFRNMDYKKYNVEVIFEKRRYEFIKKIDMYSKKELQNINPDNMYDLKRDFFSIKINVGVLTALRRMEFKQSKKDTQILYSSYLDTIFN
jgi:hypothetical protein